MSTANPSLPAADDHDAVLAALAAGDEGRRAGRLAAVAAYAWRAMRKIRHVPEQLMDVTVMPVLVVVMFTYLFGGAIAGSTGEYLQFLLPGILSFVLFSAVYSGVAVNTDVTKGVIDRFRSLPAPPSAPLVGAALGDAVRFLAGTVVIIALGFVLGFTADGGVLGVVAAAALVVVFASGLSWIFTVAGLVMRAPNAVMNVGNMTLFPLIFLSNVFVPTDTLPGWLQTLVDVNPVTNLVTATRGLMEGNVPTTELAITVGTAVALTLILAPIATALYRRK